MLDEATRTAILRLNAQGHGSRSIARALDISRGAVRAVLASRSASVPRIARAEKADAYRDAVVELYVSCKGNLVRVHEELARLGAEVSYQALTAFCRRHGIGRPPAEPAGRYEFGPGVEMQHDTSPHRATIAGRQRRVQTASLVQCFSRGIFMQLYPSFTRFTCKVFLTDAITYFGGAAGRCMIDNTHVVVLSGTGKEMVPVPEMAAFAERYGFTFVAHEKGDANRSAKVERPFDFIENNFLAGREFTDWEHANREAVAWCDRVNAAFNKRLHACRRELLATERPQLQPLPIWVPEVYVLHQRIVDLEGYVNLHRNRYSVPYKLIGRQLEVRELKDRVDVYDGPRIVASHRRVLEPLDARVTDLAHRPARGEGTKARAFRPVEEQRLAELAPELTEYVNALKARPGGATRQLRALLRLVQDYPREPLVAAVRTATEYRLYDLTRVERILLRSLGRDYFQLPPGPIEPEDDNEG